jgi:hypothetical protein
LDGKSEPPLHDEHLDDGFVVDVLFVSLQKLHDVLVVELDLRLTIVRVDSLVLNHQRNEVHHLDRCLLLGIDLCSFNLDKGIADVLFNFQINFVGKHVLDNIIIFCFNQ